MKHPLDNPHHDRLDLKLSVLEYTDKPCGAINLKTRQPEYCDFRCPTLHGQQPMPEPHWTTDEAQVAARMKELVDAKVQVSTAIETAIAGGANVPAGMIEVDK